MSGREGRMGHFHAEHLSQLKHHVQVDGKCFRLQPALDLSWKVCCSVGMTKPEFSDTRKEGA